jgi:hypothetical protein
MLDCVHIVVFCVLIPCSDVVGGPCSASSWRWGPSEMLVFYITTWCYYPKTTTWIITVKTQSLALDCVVYILIFQETHLWSNRLWKLLPKDKSDIFSWGVSCVMYKIPLLQKLSLCAFSTNTIQRRKWGSRVYTWLISIVFLYCYYFCSFPSSASTNSVSY